MFGRVLSPVALIEPRGGGREAERRQHLSCLQTCVFQKAELGDSTKLSRRGAARVHHVVTEFKQLEVIQMTRFSLSLSRWILCNNQCLSSVQPAVHMLHGVLICNQALARPI